MDYILAGGLVVSSTGRERANLLIENGRIAAWVSDPAGRGLPVVDAADKLILPGLIDAHTHFQMPSGEFFTVDDFVSGGALAASAGVTSIVDFIEPVPGQDLAQAISARLGEARGCPVDYQFHLVIPQRFARDTDWYDLMEQYQLAAVKGFTTYREGGLCLDDGDIEALLDWARLRRGLFTLHAEADGLLQEAGQQLLAGGHEQMRFFPRSRPAGAEQQAVQNTLELGTPPVPVYFVHVSAAGTLETIARARQERSGQAIWVETCPQYLVLDQSLYDGDDSCLYTVCPPLRTVADQNALWDGLRTGLVDIVASDHCPFTVEMKTSAGWQSVRPGLPAVDAILPVLVNVGIAEGRIEWEDLVRLTAENPARLFRLQGKGRLTPGSDADCLVIDQSKVTGRQERRGLPPGSRAGYSPFSPAHLERGWLEHVIRRGEFLLTDGRLADKPGEGRLIPLQ
jgi:dihydropyrimidinase